MAIWQYTFLILPKESIEVLSTDYHFEKSKEGFDDEAYWKLNSIHRDFFYALQKFLPKEKSWSNEIDLYGNQESNCLEVLFDKEGNVVSVSFRLDFRNSYEKLLSQILEFCCLNGLIILDEDLNIVFGHYEQVQKTIEDSPQARRYHELSEKDKRRG